MSNSKFTSTIYQDEAISPRKEDQIDDTPQIIKQARLLEKNIKVYSQYIATIFYLQAKLLENYEDDYEYGNVYVGYYPTYYDLNNKQLRGYFSWRTKVRKGIIKEAPICFIFIYIYEIINQIGVKTPIEGYNTLIKFKDEYQKIEPLVCQYIKRWSIDYVIYYNLDVSLLQYTRAIEYDKNLIVLLNMSMYNNEQIMKSFNALSSYKIFNSPFYKKYQNEYTDILIPTFNKIKEYYDNHHRNTLINDYFGYFDNREINIFANCVFYKSNNNSDYEKNRVYKINEIRKYEYMNYSWFTTGYNPYNYPSKKLGYLIKTIDAIMRNRFGFKRELQKVFNYKWLDKIINEQIDQYFKQKESKKEVEIDLSKLNNIRSDAIVTRDKLIIEEELIDDINEKEVDKNIMDNDLDNNTNVLLSNDEIHFINCLINNEPYQWLNEKGIILSVLIDSINDKLFDIFSDTVIIEEDKVYIIEDYIEDLKGIIQS